VSTPFPFLKAVESARSKVPTKYSFRQIGSKKVPFVPQSSRAKRAMQQFHHPADVAYHGGHSQARARRFCKSWPRRWPLGLSPWTRTEAPAQWVREWYLKPYQKLRRSLP
jgi:hypothetical protein